MDRRLPNARGLRISRRRRRGRAGYQKGPDVSFYARVLSYFAPDVRRIGLLMALIWVSLAAGVLEGAAAGALTNAVLSAEMPREFLGRMLMMPFQWINRLDGDRAGRVAWLAGCWLLLRVVIDSTTLWREMINHRLRYNGTARVRFELFDHLQQLSPAYHKSRPQGDALYRMGTDTLGFFGVLDLFIGAANSVLTVLIIGSVMAGFNVRITVVCLALTPVLVLANVRFSRTIRQTSAESKQADTDVTTFVQRAMATVSLAQLFGRQGTESTRFRGEIDRSVAAGMRMSWQVQLFPWVQRVTYAMGHAFVLGYGGWLAYRGVMSGDSNAFNVGGVAAMLVYLGQLWEPVRRMSGFTAEVQNNVAACERVFNVLDIEPTVADDPSAAPLAVRERVLELRHVAFGYEEGQAVLTDVNARIEPGQMVAFVGQSGSGKSTLLNLFPRFYDPTAGSITLDGFDLRTIRLKDIRAHVALVPQESPVIAGTIADNIAFGRPGADLEAIRLAAELAGANKFIEELPFGYLTVVSEGGQNLSGGQRQRLAIARALLTEAPILILDEPTSGLDRHHERLVLETLDRLRGDRTIVLVTHNLPAVAGCDRIFVLGNGRVLEAGTHLELLALDGVYAALVREPEPPKVRRTDWFGETIVSE